MSRQTSVEVLVVGDGVAGRTAAIFTARHGLDTLVVGPGTSLLRRNAHLENFPGFPAGVDARRLLALIGEQLERAGAARLETRVTRLVRADGGFAAETADGDRIEAGRVVVATKNEVDYLEALEVDVVRRGSKAFLDVDDRGRTGVDGLYAAGRLAGRPHQAIVAAGNGATVAVTLLEDGDEPFYHDWVAPAGYFSGRGREVPPGCEEIDDVARREREAAGRARLLEAFAGDPPGEPEQHPSVAPD